MPFATEQDIRNEAFLFDDQSVDTERLNLSLDKAHQEIINNTTLTDETTPTQNIIRAETILTIAHFFRSLAIAQAVTATHVHTSTLRIDEYSRVSHLLETSNHLWHEAWQLLKPYWMNQQHQQITITSGANHD